MYLLEKDRIHVLLMKNQDKWRRGRGSAEEERPAKETEQNRVAKEVGGKPKVSRNGS